MTCQFCGNEHMVKHETGGVISLETYARCPVCGRNDKVEKVSAILVNQTQEISGTENKQVLVGPAGQQKLVTTDVPFTRKQISVLGQRLVAPEPPAPSSYPPFPPLPRLHDKPSKGGAVTMLVIGIVIAGITLLSGLCSSIFFIAALSDASTTGAAEVGLLSLIFLLVSGFIFLVGIGLTIAGALLRRKAKPVIDPNIAIKLRHQQQVEAVQQEHERIRNGYKHAMERYEKLYCCFRDDCVFIPGENTSAPLSGMRAYLDAPSPQAPQE
jgi:hypothetical protein